MSSDDEMEVVSKAPRRATKKRKTKPKSDLVPPKKPRTAYNLFSSVRRKELKEENKDIAFGDLSKAVSADWKAIDDADKEEYLEKAKEDKERYEQELEEFKANGGEIEPPKKRAKKEKDPDAPKRPTSAYLFFAKDKRAEVKEENPSAAAKEITALLGKKWRESTEEEKAPYNVKYGADKKRYEDAQAVYLEEHPELAKTVKSAKKTKKESVPKRPKSAYLIYSASIRPDIKEENPEFTLGEVSKESSKRWKELSDDDKVEWNDLAAKDVKRFEKECKALGLDPVEVKKPKPRAKKAEKKVEKKKKGGKKQGKLPFKKRDEEEDEEEEEAEEAPDGSDPEKIASRFRKYCRGFKLKKLYRDLDLSLEDDREKLKDRLEEAGHPISASFPSTAEIEEARSTRDDK